MKTAIIIALAIFGGFCVITCLAACFVSGEMSRHEERAEQAQAEQKPCCKNCVHWMKFLPPDNEYGVCNRFTDYCQTHEETTCGHYWPK